MPREQRPLLYIIAALISAALALEIANGRFWLNDFRVYYSAADSFVHGRPVYGVAFGEDTGFYKYAPVVAMAFVPFALLPYPLAAGLHFLLIGVALCIAFVRLERLLMRHVHGLFPPRILLRGVLALLCIAVLLSRELHLGNINLWLVVGVVLATDALLEGDRAWAGVLFGALWLLKPYLAFMTIPLVMACQWRCLLIAGVTLVLGIALPFLILGPIRWLDIHNVWLDAMAAHGSYLTSPDTLTSLCFKWLDWEGPKRHPSVVVLFVGAAFAALCWWQNRKPRSGTLRTPIIQVWTAFALVPHLVITDQEHFLYSIPLIALALSDLFRRPDLLTSVLFAASMLLYATRSSDLWGTALEARWVGSGALGIGNLMLLAGVWSTHVRSGCSRDLNLTHDR